MRRALLVLYMIKGFLGYGDKEAYAVYGAYTALVYMTPFFGGLIADHLLGARRAVVLGGLLIVRYDYALTFQVLGACLLAGAILVALGGLRRHRAATARPLVNQTTATD